MRAILLCLVLVFVSTCPEAKAYDPTHKQKVKYHQSRAKWKIKANRERMKKRRTTSNYGSSSSSSRTSRSGSQSRRREASSRTPRVAPRAALTSFISAANQATRLEQLYPYAVKTKRDYWQRLNPKRKREALMSLKKWTYHARFVSADAKPMVATVKLSAPTVKGVNLWNENGVWKFSNVIKK